MKKIGLLILIFMAAFSTGAVAENNLRFIEARGIVNINEVGGHGLYVFSLWDKNKGCPIGADGAFVTVISDSRPQKLSVMDDKKMTRALTIALPEDSQRITFDAKSTAEAVLFRDPDVFSNSVEAEKFSRIIADSKAFEGLVVFLKNNLARSPLEELMNNKEYIALLEKCNAEVFGQDTEAISKSLYEAKAKLQKAFQER